MTRRTFPTARPHAVSNRRVNAGGEPILSAVVPPCPYRKNGHDVYLRDGRLFCKKCGLDMGELPPANAKPLTDAEIAREMRAAGDTCRTRSEEPGGWVCTRPAKHAGEHVACGVMGDVLARWPNSSTAAPSVPVKRAKAAKAPRASARDVRGGAVSRGKRFIDPSSERIEGGPLSVVRLSIELVSEANRASHEHWRIRDKRAGEQRAVVAGCLAFYGDDKPPLPTTVTITRIAPRALDDDNATGSAKAVRDEVAKWLGVDDRDPRVTWTVLERTEAPKTYGVEIRFAPLRPCPFCGGEGKLITVEDPFVRCGNLACAVGGPVGTSRSDATARWNGAMLRRR